MRGPSVELKSYISHRMNIGSMLAVWAPQDFFNIGSHCGVDQALVA